MTEESYSAQECPNCGVVNEGFRDRCDCGQFLTPSASVGYGAREDRDSPYGLLQIPILGRGELEVGLFVLLLVSPIQEFLSEGFGQDPVAVAWLSGALLGLGLYISTIVLRLVLLSVIKVIGAMRS